MRRLGIVRLSLEELGARLLKRNSSLGLPPRLRELRYNATYDQYELVLEGSPLLKVPSDKPIPLLDADEYLA